MSNKAIRRIKVALTTRCNLDCGYCFIRCPTSDMTWPVAKAAVDLLLGSAQKAKLLSCYGGEPLLRFALLKQMVIYARGLEKKNNKHLTIECCTNSLLLTDDYLSFFQKHDVRVHISLFGREEDNNKYRAPGFKKVIEHLAKASKVLGGMNTGVCVCVTPKTVRYLREYVETIRKKTGARVLTIEPIIGLEGWSFDDVTVFIEQIRLVCKDLIDSVTTGVPFFLKYLCWYVYVGKRHQITPSNVGYDQCPFLVSLDVSPSGDMAFSPFALYGKEEKRGVVGNVRQVQGAWWQRCTFKKGSPACVHCRSTYYSSGGLSDKSRYLRMYMYAVIDETVRALDKAGAGDKRYRRYIKEAERLYEN